MQADYNTPTKVAFTQSWASRNQSSPNPNSPRNWQPAYTAGAGSIQAPKKFTHGALSSLMTASASPISSAQDTAILGTMHQKPGGHAGHGSGCNCPACKK